MPKGNITSYIDVAQVTLYVFWIFFAGLIYYLHRENKREGYPLESDRSNSVKVHGFPMTPEPKTYLLPHGGTQTAPRMERDMRPLMAEPYAVWPGAPLVPTGNPMRDGVGPAAWTERADVPDLTVEGHPRIVPLSAATGYALEKRDPDPRGMVVIGADGKTAGTVKDVWVDRSESILRYFEVSLPAGRTVLLPTTFARVSSWQRQIAVKSVLSTQFADVPGTQSPNQVTRREEDRICAYYGGGTLYATRARTESIL